MPKPEQLIRTKIHLPFIRPGLVNRPRLEEQIKQGLFGPLTMITAPAGFGKTTLVASCVTGCGKQVAWLSLDKNDNRTGRFLNYLVAALKEVGLKIRSETVQLLSNAPEVPAEAVLTSLINDLDGDGKELVLVLDDYQHINVHAVHDAVAFLIEHHPNTFHLVITTRSDPPLPLPRLRARGQIVELRAIDLRFTEAEAAQFLNDVMGLRLDAKSVAILEERTEGWVAGLQMAALSMRDRKDLLQFIEGFSGTNRYILDYLLEEVMASQPPQIQWFLLCTSILDRLTAPLCAAILKVEKSDDWKVNQSFEPFETSNQSSCQQILEYLERANLFLMPLDDARNWYRYHHLFVDLLTSQLLRLHPKIIPELHFHASLWYEQNGWLDQAVEHAFSAGDLDRAGRLVESGAQKLIYQVPFETIQEWINRLPEETVLQRTWLGITQGWLWIATMQTSRLERWTARVEEYFLARNKDHYTSTERQDIEANLASLRAYDAFFKGNLQHCADVSLHALKLLSPANSDLRVRILVQLGETYLALMDLEQASAYLNKAVDEALNLGDFQSATTASMRLFKALKILGRLNEAESLILRVFKALADAGRANTPVANKLEQCWGDLLRERGKIAEAGVQLAQAIEHARQYQSPLDMVTARIYQSIWLIDQSDLNAAHDILEEAKSLIHTFTIPSIVVATWSLQQTRLYLEQGDLECAEKTIGDPVREESRIVYARLLLKKGAFEKASRLLDQLEQDASACQQNGHLIQIMIYKAIVFSSIGNQSKALETLIEGLTLAHSQGYVMMFLEEGRPVHDLLKLLHKRQLPQPLAEYVLRLLEAFEQRRKQMLPLLDADEHPMTMAQEMAARNDELVEPLSTRELEVLRLLAQGRTNPEIARHLIVAPGTIKAHAASIYRKLDVTNRTEAVMRARQLGILP